MGTELSLQTRAVCPGLDSRCSRNVIHLQHLVQRRQVYGDDAIVAIGRLEARHGGTPAAVGDGRVAVGGAPLQHGGHLVFGGRVGDDVGRIGKLQIVGPNPVAEAATVGMDGPVVVVGGAD